MKRPGFLGDPAPHGFLRHPAGGRAPCGGVESRRKKEERGRYTAKRKAQTVKVIKGADNIGVYHQTERSYRKWCKTCGGHLFTDHPEWNLVDVYAATIPAYPFKAGVHVNDAQTVLPMKDGLPKLKDFPPELGGSGQAAPE